MEEYDMYISELQKQLFTWDEYEVDKDMSVMFSNVQLVRDIGKYKKGQKFDYASLNFEEMELTFGVKTKSGKVIYNPKPILLKIDVVNER